LNLKHHLGFSTPSAKDELAGAVHDDDEADCRTYRQLMNHETYTRPGVDLIYTWEGTLDDSEQQVITTSQQHDPSHNLLRRVRSASSSGHSEVSHASHQLSNAGCFVDLLESNASESDSPEEERDTASSDAQGVTLKDKTRTLS